MRFLIANWRLKLLALGLTLGLLGAVAFSQNPVSVASVPASVDYDSLDPSYVIINPILRTQVTVIGPAAVTSQLQIANPPPVRFRVDMRDFRVSTQSHTFFATPKSLPPGVTWTGDSVPIAVGVDKVDTKALDIQVRPLKTAPGYKVLDKDANGKWLTYAYCDNPGERCQVQVTAPDSILNSLTAYVETDVTGTTVDSPTQPVKFEKDGKATDLSKLNTFPPVKIVNSTVNVHVTAQQSQVARQVALKVSVTGRPACGFAVTGLSYQPDAFVTITGAADKIATVDSISLPRSVDITGATGDVHSKQDVPTDSGTPSPTSVTVTVSIQKVTDCVAPTPTPLPTPSPTR